MSLAWWRCGSCGNRVGTLADAEPPTCSCGRTDDGKDRKTRKPMEREP